MPKKYVLCTDGSYVTVALVTRWFVQEDVTSGTALIKASAPGFHPFTVAKMNNLEAALAALEDLIDHL